ncbi:phosphonate ABC transporter, permease protein PhnE [Lysobacter korlensis]|uniref:Phosphonate ABC transporter, permease protein PhnE n=1 Tax=Lysobacter korlensis TaxID=553636 RepID=A0ABV6RMI7_9GAMM
MTAATATGARTERPKRPSKARYVALEIAALVLVVVCLIGVDAKWARLLEAPGEIWNYLGLMARGVFQNPFADPYAEYWTTSFEFMFESLAMAWVGTVIGALLSVPFGFLAASNVAPAPVVFVVRQFLNAIRAIPDVILAIVIMVPIFGLGPLPGALAIGVGSIGTLGKLTSEVIEGIATGPVEALRSSGARPLQVLRWSVLPQVLPEIVAFWLYRFEVNIRASAILGVVGAGGIGSLLSRVFDGRDWDRVGIALVVIIGVTMIVDQISASLRHRIITGGERIESTPRTLADFS